MTSTPGATPTPGDDFNRADSTNLGPKWTERSGDWKIASQTLRNATTAADHVVTYTAGPYTTVTVSAQVQIMSGSGTVLLGARWGGYTAGLPTTGYAVELSSDGVWLWRVTNWVLLGSYQVPYTPGQVVTLTLRANGSSLSVDVNGVTRISATDSAYASGDVGLWSFAPSAPDQHRFDNFTIQE